jgi:hypothetical protein
MTCFVTPACLSSKRLASVHQQCLTSGSQLISLPASTSVSLLFSNKISSFCRSEPHPAFILVTCSMTRSVSSALLVSPSFSVRRQRIRDSPSHRLRHRRPAKKSESHTLLHRWV